MSENYERNETAEVDKATKYAVTTTENTAEEFRKLADGLGITQKDLFSSMIELFKASNAVNGVNKTKELQDLGRHLKRIEEIYVALVNELGDHKQDSKLAIEQLMTDHTEKLKLKNEEIDRLNLDLDVTKELFKEAQAKAEQAIKTQASTEQILDVIKKANQRLEEDNNTLEERNKQLEPLYEENMKLQQESNVIIDNNTKLQQENESFLKKVSELEPYVEKSGQLQEVVNRLTQEKEAQDRNHKKAIDEMQLQHKMDLFELEKKLSAETRKALDQKDSEIDELRIKLHELETDKNKLLEDFLKLQALVGQDPKRPKK
jgi:myosin heavy subunit